MQVRMIVEGGNMKPSPAISQKLGPLGLNMGKLMQDVNNSTKDYKGMKVPVVLNIDSKTKQTKVEVLSPPASEMLKKLFGLEKGSGQPHKVKVGNVAIEQIIKIAKSKMGLEKNLKSAVKSVVGSCQSLGILVESKEPKEAMKDVDNGSYDNAINQELTEPSSEKLEELNAFFSNVQKSQEELKKKEEEEKAKAEEAKAAAATAAAAPAAGTAAAAPTAAAAQAKAPAAKTAAKAPAGK